MTTAAKEAIQKPEPQQQTVTLLTDVYYSDDDNDIEVAAVKISLSGLVALQNLARRAASIWEADVNAVEFRAPLGVEVNFLFDTDDSELMEIVRGEQEAAVITFTHEGREIEETIERAIQVTHNTVVAVKNEISESLLENFHTAASLLHANVIFSAVDTFVISCYFKHVGGSAETHDINIKVLESLFE